MSVSTALKTTIVLEMDTNPTENREVNSKTWTEAIGREFLSSLGQYALKLWMVEYSLAAEILLPQWNSVELLVGLG